MLASHLKIPMALGTVVCASGLFKKRAHSGVRLESPFGKTGWQAAGASGMWPLEMPSASTIAKWLWAR